MKSASICLSIFVACLMLGAAMIPAHAAMGVASSAVPAMSVNNEGVETLQAFVERMHPGWNLGNTLDATGSETSWGNPLTTRQHIEFIAAAGFKSIRIPITWGHRMGPAPDYQINETFINRVQQIVDWSLDAGLIVMINLHHDSGWIFHMERDHDQVLARFKAAWVQIADHFKEYPSTLLFEGINEPRFSDDWGLDTPVYFRMLEELDTSFHEIVRKSGGNNATRPLVLSTLTAAVSQPRMNALLKTIQDLDDPNIIATIHYYGYWPFSVNIAGSTKFDHRALNDIVQTFDRAYNTFVAKGIPVVIGEYGLLGFDRSYDTIQHGEVLKYFEWVNFYAQEKRLPLMLWDNGQHFNRRASRWNDDELHRVIMASLSGRSSNSESDTIFIKKSDLIDGRLGDVRIKLNLHGNELVEIRHGDQVLNPEVDYVLSQATLTIDSGAIQSLLTGEYGHNATLTLSFSHGADWDVHILVVDPPVLKDAVGTTSSLTIPTEFNGDRLATMEARYPSGANAGPADWTPFKEFGHSFSPSYGNSQIVLKREFWNEIKDGEVRLRFHFWSGEIVDYTVVKDGLKVVGYP